VADDRRVDEQVQRFGGQDNERRRGQRQDLPGSRAVRRGRDAQTSPSTELIRLAAHPVSVRVTVTS
jgi:hypothetical protein